MAGSAILECPHDGVKHGWLIVGRNAEGDTFYQCRYNLFDDIGRLLEVGFDVA